MKMTPLGLNRPETSPSSMLPPGVTMPNAPDMPRRRRTDRKDISDLVLSRDLSELLGRDVFAAVDIVTGDVVISDRNHGEIDVPPEVVEYALKKNAPPPSPAQRALAAFDAAATAQEKLDIALRYLR